MNPNTSQYPPEARPNEEDPLDSSWIIAVQCDILNDSVSTLHPELTLHITSAEPQQTQSEDSISDYDEVSNIALAVWRSCWERVQSALEDDNPRCHKFRHKHKKEAMKDSPKSPPCPITLPQHNIAQKQLSTKPTEQRGNENPVSKASNEVHPVQEKCKEEASLSEHRNAPPPEKPIIARKNYVTSLSDKPVANEKNTAELKLAKNTRTTIRHSIDAIVAAHKRLAEDGTLRAKEKVEEIMAEAQYRTAVSFCSQRPIHVSKYRTMPVSQSTEKLPEDVMLSIQKFKEEEQQKSQAHIEVPLPAVEKGPSPGRKPVENEASSDVPLTRKAPAIVVKQKNKKLAPLPQRAEACSVPRRVQQANSSINTVRRSKSSVRPAFVSRKILKKCVVPQPQGKVGNKKAVANEAFGEIEEEASLLAPRDVERLDTTRKCKELDASNNREQGKERSQDSALVSGKPFLETVQSWDSLRTFSEQDHMRKTMHNVPSRHKLDPLLQAEPNPVLVQSHAPPSLGRCMRIYGKSNTKLKHKTCFELTKKPAWDSTLSLSTLTSEWNPKARTGSKTERRADTSIKKDIVGIKLKGSCAQTEKIDWAQSGVYQAAKQEEWEFNASDSDPGVYYEAELPYILAMLSKPGEKNVCRHFWNKAKSTIKKLAIEMMNPSSYVELDQKYPNVSAESAVQLLNACVDLMATRKELVGFFKKVAKRDLYYEYCLTHLRTKGTNEKEQILSSVMELQLLTEDILGSVPLISKQACWFRDPICFNRYNYLEEIRKEHRGVFELMKKRYFPLSSSTANA